MVQDFSALVHEVKTIPLTQGKVALVDDADYERVSELKWCAYRHKFGFYAVTQITIGPPKNGKRQRKTIYMHRFLADAPKGMEVHHKNTDGLDNQRHNFQVLTLSDHKRAIRRKSALTTSRFRGVSWQKRMRKWEVTIQPRGARKHLGFFVDELMAARAYDAAAKEMFGPIAQLNLP